MKILIGLDGSRQSLVARDLVAGLRWPDGTSVHLVGAYELPIDWSGGYGASVPHLVDEIEGALHDETRSTLAAAAEPLAAAGLTVTHEAIMGRPADVLLDVARRDHADLIVVGSRGRTGWQQLLLGSVATEVAADAPCPVLVARSPRVARMLVATDGSEAAARIVDLLGGWGTFAGVSTDVVGVSVPDGPLFELLIGLYTLGDERLSRAREASDAKAEADAHEAAERLSAIGIPATPRSRRGDAAEEIVAAATEAGADLVVVGSRGLSGLDRLLLGSVARNVLTHAPASVLIARKEA